MINAMKVALSALEQSCIASCSCVTKTPDTQHHAEDCNYRIRASAADGLRAAIKALEELEPVVVKELKRWGEDDWDVSWRGIVPSNYGPTCWRYHKVGDKLRLYILPAIP